MNCVIALAEKSTDALNDSGIPLCIDYAGTLTCPATRLEQMLRVAKHSPSSWLPLLRTGTGKARFWREIAARADMDNTARPLRRELLEWLELERRAGRRLVLLVDGDQRAAESLVALLPLFDSCAALDGVAGTSAERKRQALIDRFGSGGRRTAWPQAEFGPGSRMSRLSGHRVAGSLATRPEAGGTGGGRDPRGCGRSP